MAKGQKLRTLQGSATTRPTSDRVKESLFNIIAAYLTGAKVLDLYSGSGNLGIEALSRGAKSAVFVDKNEKSIRVIKENLVNTKLINKGLVIKDSVDNVIKYYSGKKDKFDVIFLDPPYCKNLVEHTLRLIDEGNVLDTNGVVSVEMGIYEKIPVTIKNLKTIDCRKYGNTVLVFYKNINC